MAYFRYLLPGPAVLFCSQLASRSAIIFNLVPPPAMFLLLNCQLCKQGRRLVFVLFKATSAMWAEHPSKDVYFLTPGARKRVKLHGKVELRLVVLEKGVILDVLCEPGVITRVLTCRRGSQERENQTDDSTREAWPDVAGSEDAGMISCMRDAGGLWKRKKAPTQISPLGGTQPCHRLGFYLAGPCGTSDLHAVR